MAGPTVALFATCVNDTMFPETPKATLRLLERLGCTVEFPLQQSCCGQPFTNTGYYAEAMGSVRNFPDAALRGELTVNSTADATLNGNAIRMAPGMRLFSPQNTLVMAHTVLGQRFKVNYVIEPSTGLLISAWILTKAEASQPRKASDSVGRNFRVDSDTTPR